MQSFFKQHGGTIKVVAIIAILFVAFLILNPFAKNNSGFRTHVQTVQGKEWVRFEPGWYWAGFLSDRTIYPDIITVQYGEDDEKGDDVTYFANPHGVRFNGGDNARIGHTVKWDLPDTEADMISIHKDYRGHKRLANTTLAQYQKETAGYATQMLDSESHYSGGQSQLKEFFQDQLRYGQILLDKEVKNIVDEITGSKETKIIVKPRLTSDSVYMRTPSDVQTYNITPSFVSVDYVKYDQLIEEKLKAKIESATVKSISEQELITAQQEALTAIEEGKKRIEQARATEEASKLTAVIQAQKEKEVAKEQALQAKYEADKVEQLGRAEAAKNRALVQAGLTPQQEMELQIEIADKVSKNLSGVDLPDVMIFGGGDGSPMNPWDAVGLESFMKIQKQVAGGK